jgi:NADH-ubiquinone oxidoreductase chain 1
MKTQKCLKPAVIYCPSLLLLIILLVLVNVAFVTLIERKVLGLSQLRKGPNKVRFYGVLQPIADAVKLFLKEFTVPFKGNKALFLIAPGLGFFLAIVLWRVVPINNMLISIWVRSVLLVTILSFGTYPLLLGGWASNRKYAIVGALRGVAQTISYEISLALIIFTLLVIGGRMKLSDVSNFNDKVTIGAVLPPLLAMWLISCVAETNRTPFDFSEGESELVSGFNIEYGSGGFTLIFIAEYSMILFFRIVRGLLIFSGLAAKFWSLVVIVALVFLWIWLRATFPRHRYDKLINLAWKTLLPLTLVNLVWVTALTAYS